MIALPARDDKYDYKFFGKQCDAIVLLNYDQHWLNSEPGPISGQDWFVENLRRVMEVVPASKIVVGVANYAYDWSEAPKPKGARGGVQRAGSAAACIRIGSTSRIRPGFAESALLLFG